MSLVVSGCSLEQKVMQNVLGSHRMVNFLFQALLMGLLRYVLWDMSQCLNDTIISEYHVFGSPLGMGLHKWETEEGSSIPG